MDLTLIFYRIEKNTFFQIVEKDDDDQRKTTIIH